LIQATSPSGTFTRTVYDDNGRAVLSTDRNGVTGTRTEYDALGRMMNTVRLTGVSIDLVEDTTNAGQTRSVIGSGGTPISTNSTEYLANGWVKSRTGANCNGVDNYFFEVKSATPKEIAKGYAKIALYNTILNTFGGPWRPGTADDYIYGQPFTLPIITQDRTGSPLPGNAVAIVLPPVGGLITYIKINRPDYSDAIGALIGATALHSAGESLISASELARVASQARQLTRVVAQGPRTVSGAAAARGQSITAQAGLMSSVGRF
jgi:YD repeat-containing protein